MPRERGEEALQRLELIQDIDRDDQAACRIPNRSGVSVQARVLERLRIRTTLDAFQRDREQPLIQALSICTAWPRHGTAKYVESAHSGRSKLRGESATLHTAPRGENLPLDVLKGAFRYEMV